MVEVAEVDLEVPMVVQTQLSMQLMQPPAKILMGVVAAAELRMRVLQTNRKEETVLLAQL